MSNLIEHAKTELERAGAGDSLYGDMLPKAVLQLLQVFSDQGHSGMSGAITLQLFTRLADFKNLSPLTDDPAEWQEVSDGMGGIEASWQNRRCSEAFSLDGGKTYYLLSERVRGEEPTMHESEKSA